MSERSQMIAWLRGELVGPSQPLSEPEEIEFKDRAFLDPLPFRRGPLSWRPAAGLDLEEVLYYERESPYRKYGAGLLHPRGTVIAALTPDQVALETADAVGAELDPDDTADDSPEDTENSIDEAESHEGGGGDISGDSDDFEVTGADVRHPSTMGISFCIRLEPSGYVVLRLPQHRCFSWQPDGVAPFPLNGRYEPCTRAWTAENGSARVAPAWRRFSAVLPGAEVVVAHTELVSGHVIRKEVGMPEGSPFTLCIEIFPRQLKDRDSSWLLTVVLRNTTEYSRDDEPRESVLYQAFFEAQVAGGCFEKYPESHRPFNQLDPEEQSLALLYRESATWGIGHGCSAGWDAEPGEAPSTIYADVMPAVQLPSMTPDIEIGGDPIRLSMRLLAELPAEGAGGGWQSLDSLATGYAEWVQLRREEAQGLPRHLAAVASRHLDACSECLSRIRGGIELLRNDEGVRRAFCLANLSMLLQQVSTKQLVRRPLGWDAGRRFVAPQGDHRSPWSIYQDGSENSERLGSWRAFQVAFLLMSLHGVSNGLSADRKIVDLIWFPTGGGKTEAYLAVMAFYMFHERILMEGGGGGPKCDGTNVLMRYTLRMLTTQQFQRAASLICAMEYLRENPAHHGRGRVPGGRFSLGLWIGDAGSPNKISKARTEIGEFQRGVIKGNPLVLTECPWCRSEIGRFDGRKPTIRPRLSDAEWDKIRTRGISDDPVEGPRLQCPDSDCIFGVEHKYLPVEVIDERIYRYPPSLIIATADKLAMLAYRPDAGALFGRRFVGNAVHQVCKPPGLIVQDELHLISGPLGTMYALYEAVFERLCSYECDGEWIGPKLIASTATIRGAADQVRALYARVDPDGGSSMVRLFPCPGLHMGDSFFGKYARDANGKLRDGRLYLGIHACDYGSVLTTQVRAFSSALFRPASFAEDRRDPWWTLLAFYNSIRELGGANTLFHSDIVSRLRFMFNREGVAHNKRRDAGIVEELTSRLSQAEIVAMLDRLSASYLATDGEATLDACLASNIIEVGVDIERLSLMGVVGQPKTTATYIQVTGRVGRRWWERAGLILMIYNPSKSRDRSHYEQFHSYHRRLYERVEPASATPFALSSIQRGFPGVLIAWARQHSNASVQEFSAYLDSLEAGYQLLRDRCGVVQQPEDQARSIAEMDRVWEELNWKWEQNPQEWESFPPSIDGEYLMLWPGQFATALQKRRGVVVPSSMRQVDSSAELIISQGYAAPGLPEEQAAKR